MRKFTHDLKEKKLHFSKKQTYNDKKNKKNSYKIILKIKIIKK